MIVSSTRRVKIALFFRFWLELSFLSFLSVWVKISLFFKGREFRFHYFPLPMVPYGTGVTQGPRMLGGFLVKFALSQLSFIYILSTSSDSSTPVQIPLPQCSFTYPSLVSSPLQATFQFPLLLSNSSISSPLRAGVQFWATVQFPLLFQQFHSKQRFSVADKAKILLKFFFIVGICKSEVISTITW